MPNKVVALRNGTMGWHLAGLTCDHGKDKRAPGLSGAGLAWAKSKAAEVARRFGITRIDRAALARWQSDATRTTYLFDVRDPAEYQAGHLPGAISAPGGQLVQATDLYAGTLGARIVLSDDNEVRAVMTASWLKQMGWQDVAVLPEAGQKSEQETGTPPDLVLGTAPADASVEFSDVLAIDDVTVIDLSRSPDYRKGHIPGAWFAIRSRLAHALAKISQHGTLVLTSEDGVLAGLAAAEAADAHCNPRSLAQGRQRRLGRRRLSAFHRRQNGGRAARRLAQALRTAGRPESRHERIFVMGNRPADAHRARRHDAFLGAVITASAPPRISRRSPAARRC